MWLLIMLTELVPTNGRIGVDMACYEKNTYGINEANFFL